MKLLFLIAVFTLSFGELKYNSFSGEWERARPDEVLKYNGFNNQWSYENPDSKLEYNGFDNTWGYN